MKIPDRIDKTNRNLRDILLRQLDLIGFTLFAPAVIMLLFAVEWGGVNYPWTNSRIIGLFIGSGVTFIAFLIWARYKGETALIPLGFFSNSVIVCSCLTGFFQMGGLLLLTYYLPIWFQVIKAASPTMSGVMNLPTMIAMIFGTVLAGWAGKSTRNLGHVQKSMRLLGYQSENGATTRPGLYLAQHSQQSAPVSCQHSHPPLPRATGSGTKSSLVPAEVPSCHNVSWPCKP
jgi:Fungal trichothecene efflux pump (TRI12)